MDEIQDRMASLRVRFQARLADDVARMEEIVAGTPSATDLIELQSIAHKLAGISGSLGLPEITEASRPIDRDWLFTAADVKTIRALVVGLRDAVRAL